MHSRFDTESRIAVAQAADIARELGHQEVGPGHLLLGLLANPRGTAYAVLWDHGLDLDTARDLVAQHHVEAEPETDEPGGSTDSTTAPDYAEDREALKAIGIDLDRVRDAVRENLGADLADGWAGRSDRGRSRGDRRRRRRTTTVTRATTTTRAADAVGRAAGGTTDRASRASCAPSCATHARRRCATASRPRAATRHVALPA